MRTVMESQTAKPNAAVIIGNVTFANDRPIALFAGPCQMESHAHALEMASALKEICGRLGIGLNGALRYSPGSGKARPPVVTDVHETAQCARVAEVVDVFADPGPRRTC
jgi:2-dehydro-3-deoxyphosphooctonate aldolase (KDO 8-P synthase)